MKLPATPSLSPSQRARVEATFERTRHHPPSDLADIIREDLGVDLATEYGGVPIPHPFGKASGQLSCTMPQVEEDLRSGIAFVVLKTVIAEASSGERSMESWTVRDTKMQVEQRSGRTGREGWTVTWTGRGWHGTLADYLTFFEGAQRLAAESDVPIVPSVKYHLPAADEPFRVEEYEHTTTQLLGVWDRAGCDGAMLLEKDFSPTLAGDPRSAELDAVLRWLEEVPTLVDSSAPGRVRLGVKVMNATADDDFQVAMLETLTRVATPPPAYLVVFNRLFDAGSRVAYGGWDLSDRNLRVLDLARQRGVRLPALSATGNICSGRVMLQYAMRGCENGQVHTFFQVPRGEYTARGGSRTSCALHTLLLHPTEGLVPWLCHLGEVGWLDAVDGEIRFRDVMGRAHG